MTTAPGARPLGLGTAQLGLDYGITNAAGQVPQDEAAAMLRLAADAWFDTIDTAFLYGDSERVIGRVATPPALKIVTKTPKFADAADGAVAASRLRTALDESLRRLDRQSVDALLAHDADDLLGPNGAALWTAMEQAREAGLVGRIGASVYDGAQIDALLERFPIELVQLPWSPIDRRFDDNGSIDRLVAAGVEIHARSLFLQGLLLTDPARIAARFGPLRTAVAALHGWASAHGLSPLEGVMALAFQETAIARFIVGATSAAELAEIMAGAERAAAVAIIDRFSVPVPLDARYLNPSRWPELDGQG